MELLNDAEVWVVIAFCVFIVLAFRPAAKMLTAALDGRANHIRNDLEEAQRLRLEAEQILAEYKNRQAEVAQESKAILTKARADAKQIAKDAQTDLEAQIEKHTSMAMDKITQAQTKALGDVQNHMLDVAVAASRAMMRDYMAKGGNAEYLKSATAEIARKLH